MMYLTIPTTFSLHQESFSTSSVLIKINLMQIGIWLKSVPLKRCQSYFVIDINLIFALNYPTKRCAGYQAAADQQAAF